MNIESNKENSVQAFLDHWYQSIHNEDEQASSDYAKEAESLARHLTDPKEKLYYQLLTFRHNILIKNFDKCKVIIPILNKTLAHNEGELYFLFNLFLGIYYFNLKEYSKSIYFYKKAENAHAPFLSPIRHAELFYRTAIFYYQTRKTFSSINYAKKAQKLYSNTRYELQTTWCEVVLGLCSISMNNYEQAEVNFLSALDHANKIKANELTTNIRFNLGFLYSEQNLSKVSIRHLEHVINDRNYKQKAAFLLAREHYKLGERKSAEYYIKLGYEICQSINDNEYIYHLNILNALNANSSLEELQIVVKEAIQYFEHNNLWGFVQDYCEMLGKRLYLSESGKEQASEYYHMASDAKKHLF